MRALLWRAVRALLFRLDPERAHRLTLRMIRTAGVFGAGPLRIACGAPREFYPAEDRPRVFGMEFRSRAGLAAGFDKDAELVALVPALGFGFAEIGTVTPRPQPGNVRPRLFRDPETRSLFNRMGFNGAGADAVSRNLARARAWLAADFRIGVNVGKNRDTPLENAAADYRKAAAAFRGLADYLVINVSSPNTPGLRSLQEAAALRPIVDAVADAIAGWDRRPPLLLKLAPEVEGESLAELIGEAERWGIQGWVLTNTLAGTLEGNSGGWSGGRLSGRARASLVQARAASRLPIISVGGILTAEEAIERRQAGADLIQLYSGWVYGGPALPADVGRGLARLETKKP